MTDIAQRLREFRKSLDLTQGEMAEKIGIPQTTWSAYERGRSGPTLGFILKLEEIGFKLGLKPVTQGFFEKNNIDEETFDKETRDLDPETELRDLDISRMQKRPLPDTTPLHTGEISKDDFLVPLLDQKLSAGKGQYLPDDDTPKTFISAPKHLQKYGKNLAALYVDGDSMEPTLNRGDMIICDSLGWSGEGIYAIQMDNCGFVKRISRRPGKTVIISDNPAYESFEEPIESEAVRIIGRVRCVVRIVE